MRAIMHLRLICLLCFVFFCRSRSVEASPSALSVNSDIQACRTAFLADPSNYDSARCFLVLPKSVRRGAGLHQVEQLLARYPESINLALAHQFLIGPSRDYHTRRTILEDLLHRATQVHDARAQVCVVSHLLFLSSRYGETRDEREDLEHLRVIGDTSDDDVAVSHAHALLIDVRNRQEIDVGGSASLLEVSSEDQNQVPYYVLRTVLRVRAESSRLAGRFENAARDFESLKAAALARNDWITHSMASLGLALVLFDQVHVNPTEIGFKAVTAAYEEVLTSAARSGAERTRLMASIHLGMLRLRLHGASDLAQSIIQECVQLATDGRNKNKLGLCLANQSQMLASSSPELALLKAIESLEVLEDSSVIGSRISAWRQVARRLWQVGGKDRGLPIALSILDEIEELRLSQSLSRDRIRRQAAWAMDYYWTISRLIASPSTDRHDLDLVLTLGERLRSRELMDRIHNSNEHRSVRRRESPAIGSHDRLHEYARLLQEFANAKRAGAPVEAIEQSLVDAEGELLRFSDAMQEMHDTKVSVSSVQDLLDPDESIVVFYALPSQGIDGEHIGKPGAILISSDSAQWVELEIDRSEVRSIASTQQDASRRNISFLGSVNRRILDNSLAPLMRELSPNTKSLVISGDGPFHLVAFESLFQDRALVSRTPSVAYWLRTRARRTSTEAPRPQPLIVADPDYGSPDSSEADLAGLERLAHSLEEAESIPNALGTKTRLLSGAEATRSKVRSEWNPSRRLIHFAVHAKVNLRDSRTSHIALAPEQHDKSVSTLSWTEIQSMDFSDSVVVMSGCSTATGPVIDGEGVQSLARMFLQSKAIAVVSSLWDVRDDEASVFFTDFYECVGTGATIGDCLHHAREKALSRTDWSASTAGFILVGDPALVLVPRSGYDARRLWWILLAPLWGAAVYLKRSIARG